MIPFPPVVEPDLPGAFITQHPRDVYEPHAISIPWMTGLTSDEGAMKSARKLTLFFWFDANKFFEYMSCVCKVIRIESVC